MAPPPNKYRQYRRGWWVDGRADHWWEHARRSQSQRRHRGRRRRQRRRGSNQQRHHRPRPDFVVGTDRARARCEPGNHHQRAHHRGRRRRTVLGDPTDLTLSPYNIAINANISFTGAAGQASSVFTLNPNNGSSVPYTLARNATASFADTGYNVAVNGTAFTLVGSAASLAADLAASPGAPMPLRTHRRLRNQPQRAASLELHRRHRGLQPRHRRAVDRRSDRRECRLSWVDSGSVQDVVFTNASIVATAAGANVGILAGTMSGQVSNVFVTGSVSGASSATVGGIMGLFSSSKTLNDNLASDAAVTGGDNALVGGVAGSFVGTGGVSGSFAIGPVSGGNSATVGGFAGANALGAISDSTRRAPSPGATAPRSADLSDPTPASSNFPIRSGRSMAARARPSAASPARTRSPSMPSSTARRPELQPASATRADRPMSPLPTRRQRCNPGFPPVSAPAGASLQDNPSPI